MIPCLMGLFLWGIARAGEGAFDQGLLFEVRSEGAPPSYLFGTIHSEDARVLDLPSPVREALDGSDVFVMEVVPDAESIIRATVAMVYRDGRKLKDVVGKDLFRQVAAAIKGRGLSEEAIAHFKPWVIVTLLSMPAGKTGELLDIALYNSALVNSKPVIGLETMEEQLAVFNGLSERDQVALLQETLRMREQLPEAFERLLDAYLQRDLAELMRLGGEYLQGGDGALAGRFKAAVLDMRNVRLTERMIPLFAHGGHFVAVGALHLPGSDGILARLSAAGFDLRPVY